MLSMGYSQNLRKCMASRLSCPSHNLYSHQEYLRTKECISRMLCLIEPYESYLGYLVTCNRRNMRVFTPILDRLASKVTSWNYLRFSAVGRRNVVQINSLDNPNLHYMSFQAPQVYYYMAKKIISKFFRRSTGVHRHLHCALWKNLCQPKNLGHIGIRDWTSFNLVFLAKKVWRMISNPNNISSKIMQEKYKYTGLILEAKQKKN